MAKTLWKVQPRKVLLGKNTQKLLNIFFRLPMKEDLTSCVFTEKNLDSYISKHKFRTHRLYLHNRFLEFWTKGCFYLCHWRHKKALFVFYESYINAQNVLLSKKNQTMRNLVFLLWLWGSLMIAKNFRKGRICTALIMEFYAKRTRNRVLESK